MPFIDNLIGVGLEPEVAAVLNKLDVDSAPTYNFSTTSLTATGTTITDALQLTGFYSNVGTVALNTGVKLPQQWPIGVSGYVYNGGANVLRLYPPNTSSTLLGQSAGAHVTIAAGAANLIIKTTNFAWVAFQLTIESQT